MITFCLLSSLNTQYNIKYMHISTCNVTIVMHYFLNICEHQLHPLYVHKMIHCNTMFPVILKGGSEIRSLTAKHEVKLERSTFSWSQLRHWCGVVCVGKHRHTNRRVLSTLRRRRVYKPDGQNGNSFMHGSSTEREREFPKDFRRSETIEIWGTESISTHRDMHTHEF